MPILFISRAGSLVVAYENSALFQNTGFISSGLTQTVGVVVGSPGGAGTLTIETVDDSNAFALFGQLNDLTGQAAALAGPNVVIFDSNLQPGSSRINGCQIGSGAGCLTTQIGTTTLDVPRENVNLLGADSDFLVPFDPLIGTNNEGLFSDATSRDASEDCLRNELGECVSLQGAK